MLRGLPSFCKIKNAIEPNPRMKKDFLRATLRRDLLSRRVVKNVKSSHSTGVGDTAAVSRDRRGWSARGLACTTRAITNNLQRQSGFHVRGRGLSGIEKKWHLVSTIVTYTSITSRYATNEKTKAAAALNTMCFLVSCICHLAASWSCRNGPWSSAGSDGADSSVLA